MRYMTIASVGMVGLYVAATFQFGITRGAPLVPTATALVALLFAAGLAQKAILVPNERMVKIFGMLFTTLIAFSVFVSLSQNSLDPLVTYSFFAMAAFICILFGANASDRDIERMASLQLVIFFALCAYCLVSQSFRLWRFRGAFDNSNGMGRFAFTQVVLCLIYWRLRQETPIKTNLALNLAALATALIFLLASQSRTALAATAVSGAIFLLSQVRFTRMKVRKRDLIRILLAVGGISIFAIASYQTGLWTELANKMSDTLESGDISQSRFGMWEIALQNLTLYGYADYQSVLNIRSAHNNYLHMSLNYGTVSAILYFGALLIIALLGWVSWRRAATASGVSAVMAAAGLLMYFMGESGAAIALVWVTYIFAGLTIRDNIWNKRRQTAR